MPIDRETLIAALHDVAKQYVPPTSDYLIQRFADRVLHEAAKLSAQPDERTEAFTKFLIEELGPDALNQGKMSFHDVAEKAFKAGRASVRESGDRWPVYVVYRSKAERGTCAYVSKDDADIAVSQYKKAGWADAHHVFYALVRSNEIEGRE